MSCFRQVALGYSGRLLRDTSEAFREGRHASLRSKFVSSFSRLVSTAQDRDDAEGGREILGKSVRPPVSPRRNSVSGGSLRAGGRSSRAAGKVGRALGLKEFMHRTRVLGLYRGILQRARAIEDKDVAAEARRQFKSFRHETDSLKIQMLVTDATNYLETLQGTTGETGTSIGGGGGGVDGSWLDIDDPEDKRGRVGEGFPWQR